MTDEIVPTRRSAVLTLAAGVATAGLGAVAAWHTSGIATTVLTGVFLLGLTVAGGAVQDLYVFHEPLADTAARERVISSYALVFLMVFFLGSTSFVGWAVLSPDGGCLDCDTTSGHLLGGGILVAGWVGALLCGRALVTLRRGARPPD